jgi:hypothetical protein
VVNIFRYFPFYFRHNLRENVREVISICLRPRPQGSTEELVGAGGPESRTLVTPD